MAGWELLLLTKSASLALSNMTLFFCLRERVGCLRGSIFIINKQEIEILNLIKKWAKFKTFLSTLKRLRRLDLKRGKQSSKTSPLHKLLNSFRTRSQQLSNHPLFPLNKKQHFLSLSNWCQLPLPNKTTQLSLKRTDLQKKRKRGSEVYLICSTPTPLEKSTLRIWKK